MNTKVQETNPALNAILWIVVTAIVVAAIYGNNYFGGESILYRALGLLAATVVASLVALQTTRGKAFWELLKGARVEIRKVVWPTRQETLQTSLIVLAVVILTGLILWGLDTLFGWLASLVIG